MGRFWNCAGLTPDNPSILTVPKVVNGDVGVKVKVRRADARESAVGKTAKSGSSLKLKVQVVCSPIPSPKVVFSPSARLITKSPLVIVSSKEAFSTGYCKSLLSK